MSKYSFQLGTVTIKLQSKSLDFYSLQNHIQDFINTFKYNKERSDVIFNIVFKEAVNILEKFV